MSRQPNDPKLRFAETVTQLQRDRGLADDELAARAGLELRELEEIHRGEGRIEIDLILLLAGALEVEPGRLLSGLAWKPDGEGGGEYRDVDPDGA